MKKVLLAATTLLFLSTADISAQQMTRTPVGFVTSTLNVMSPSRLPQMLTGVPQLNTVQIGARVHAVATDGSWMMINSGANLNDFVLVKRTSSDFSFTNSLIGKMVAVQGDVTPKELSNSEKAQYLNGVNNAPTSIYEISSTGYYIYE